MTSHPLGRARQVADAQARRYEQRVRTIAAELRELADRVERRAIPDSVKGESKYTTGASDVVNDVLHGVSHLRLELLVEIAGEADVAATDASYQDPGE